MATDDPKDTPTPSTPTPAWKRWLFWVAVVSGTHGALFVAGYFKGSLEVSGAEKALQNEKAQHAGKVKELEASVKKLEGKLVGLEARHALDMAIVELDARNFGITQDHVTRAGRMLAALPAPNPLEALANTLSAARLVATEDLAAQRAQIKKWLVELDGALPQDHP
jgi:hypothetical protein